MKRRVSFQVLIVLILFGVVIVKGTQYAWNYDAPENSQVSAQRTVPYEPTSTSDYLAPDREGPVAAPITYESIAESNLFRPLGWEKPNPSPSPPPVPRRRVTELVRQPPPPPARYLTLTGIAQNGSKWLAILEGTGDQEAYFVHQGETLRNATIREITPEHLVLDGNGTERTLALGQSIHQEPSGLLRFEPISHQPALAAETRSETEPTLEENSEMSLLERMRARRRRELAQ